MAMAAQRTILCCSASLKPAGPQGPLRGVIGAPKQRPVRPVQFKTTDGSSSAAQDVRANPGLARLLKGYGVKSSKQKLEPYEYEVRARYVCSCQVAAASMHAWDTISSTPTRFVLLCISAVCTPAVHRACTAATVAVVLA